MSVNILLAGGVAVGVVCAGFFLKRRKMLDAQMETSCEVVNREIMKVTSDEKTGYLIENNPVKIYLETPPLKILSNIHVSGSVTASDHGRGNTDESCVYLVNLGQDHVILASEKLGTVNHGNKTFSFDKRPLGALRVGGREVESSSRLAFAIASAPYKGFECVGKGGNLQVNFHS